VLPAAVVIGDEENFGGGFTGRSPEAQVRSGDLG